MSLLSQQLSFRARHKLAQVLDQENVRGCDWRTLVELMGFSYEMVMMLRSKESPTMVLLEEWELREGNSATLESLILMVEELGNVSAVGILQQVKEDINRKPLPRSPKSPRSFHPIRKGSNGSNGGRESPFISDIIDQSNKPYIDPINIDKIHSESTDVSKDVSSIKDSEGELIEAMRGRALSDLDRSLLRGHEFDVFLSFAPADAEFAVEMRLRLVHRAGISVYIPSEGIMPGQCFQDEVADKIKRGCRKTIILLSPDYNDCSWCNYEARLAHHRNPDPRRHTLIPVMYQTCTVPDFISHLYYLDYSRYKGDHRQCEQYFWDRLYKSVRHQQR